jgi:hypothetical protein
MLHDIIQGLAAVRLVQKSNDIQTLNTVNLEVFTAVTTKNGVFWDVTPYGSSKNRRFEGT